MAKRKHSKADLLEEAGSATTSAARLQALVKKEPTLGGIIASNPSASWKLLNQLALQHPAEVLTNPLLLLLSLEGGRTYRKLSLPALVCLCLACEPKQHAELLEETRLRIQSGLDELGWQKKASLSCEWVYQRSFTLHPEDCSNLINHSLDLTLEVTSPMVSHGHVAVGDIPDLNEPFPDPSLRNELAAILESISSGSISDYINDDELIRSDGGGGDFVLEAAELPEDLSILDASLYRGEDCILDFEKSLDGDKTPVRFARGVITVPVEFAYEQNHSYKISMGELGALQSLSHAHEASCLPSDWTSRLATLLIP